MGSFIAITILELGNVFYLKQPFDAMRYGTGLAAILTGLGLSIIGDAKGKKDAV